MKPQKKEHLKTANSQKSELFDEKLKGRLEQLK
jgi:hypothetical protein